MTFEPKRQHIKIVITFTDKPIMTKFLQDIVTMKTFKENIYGWSYGWSHDLPRQT